MRLIGEDKSKLKVYAYRKLREGSEVEVKKLSKFEEDVGWVYAGYLIWEGRWEEGKKVLERFEGLKEALKGLEEVRHYRDSLKNM